MREAISSITAEDLTNIWFWLNIIKYFVPLTAAYFINKYIDKKLSNQLLGGQLFLVVAKSLATALIWVTAVIVTISFIPSFSRTWETIFAGSGIAAVVISMAAQKTFSNMITGITISAAKSRPFDVGDWIRIGDYQDGTVVDMTLRHIVIKTVNSEIIYIPNAVVDSEKVINYTKGGSTMYTITVSVAYGTDIEKASKIMAEVIEKHPLYAGHIPAEVYCTDFEESGVQITGRIVTELFSDNYRARSECRMELLKRFAEEDIEIPYNKLEILSPTEKISTREQEHENGRL